MLGQYGIKDRFLSLLMENPDQRLERVGRVKGVVSGKETEEDSGGTFSSRAHCNLLMNFHVWEW